MSEDNPVRPSMKSETDGSSTDTDDIENMRDCSLHSSGIPASDNFEEENASNSVEVWRGEVSVSQDEFEIELEEKADPRRSSLIGLKDQLEHAVAGISDFLLLLQQKEQETRNALEECDKLKKCNKILQNERDQNASHVEIFRNKSEKETLAEQLTRITAEIQDIRSSSQEVAESKDADDQSEEEDPNKIWCICRRPAGDLFMICCDTCSNWFHCECVGMQDITKAQATMIKEAKIPWHCLRCLKKIYKIAASKKQARGSRT